MKSIHVLGIMNGTSIDAVDFVLCKISGPKNLKIDFLDQYSFSFPKKIRDQLLRAANHELKVDELAKVHHDLGHYYAQKALVIKNKNSRRKIHLVGVHGQTVFHEGAKATLQIGEPSYLSQALNCPVVNDFRVADLAYGGQGAPLAPIIHLQFFKNLNHPVAVNNLGGISNVTWIYKNKILGFDTGPSNMLMDLTVESHSKGKKKFDKDGILASKGIPDQELVEKWLKTPYFRIKPPKSCGREEFGSQFLNDHKREIQKLNYEDRLATFAEFTARSISEAYNKYLPKLPKEIYLCGGGAKNPYLKYRIQYHIPDSRVSTTEELGWPVDAVEGGAFALLAAMRLWKLPAPIQTVTGAKRPSIMGKLTEVSTV